MTRIRRRLQPGHRPPVSELHTLGGTPIALPDAHRVVHLQFRRFAGCPVCKLHLRAFAQRHAELDTAGILEVAVFHSSEETLRQHQSGLPFAAVADPGMTLYRAFGVERSLRSVLDPRAWRAIARGLAAFGAGRRPGEDALGLPADFLIGRCGRVLACKYGEHADDHWSVDEVLAIAASFRSRHAKPTIGEFLQALAHEG